MKRSSKVTFRKGISDANAVVMFVLLLVGSSATAPAQTHCVSPDVYSTSSVNIGDVSNNYWGGSSISFSEVAVTYSGGTGLTSAPSRPTVYCSDGLLSPKRSHNLPLSILIDTARTHCDTLFNRGYYLQANGPGQAAYDTLRMFMEQCPYYSANGADAVEGFIYLGGAVSQWVGGQPQAVKLSRYANYLDWLKSVLYLRADSQWYCTDVSEMFSAIASNDKIWDAATIEAICKYILDNHRCGPQTDSIMFGTNYDVNSKGRHALWRDSVTNVWYKWAMGNLYFLPVWRDSLGKDTMLHPYDSTVPSIDSLGFSILRGPQYAQHAAVQPRGAISSTALLDARLLDNPMKNEITISFEMGRTALVTMELRDILGRIVPIANAKYLFEEPGTHTAHLPVPYLPSGTYYLRVFTDTGDSKTLKVVKE